MQSEKQQLEQETTTTSSAMVLINTNTNNGNNNSNKCSNTNNNNNITNSTNTTIDEHQTNIISAASPQLQNCDSQDYTNSAKRIKIEVNDNQGYLESSHQQAAATTVSCNDLSLLQSTSQCDDLKQESLCPTDTTSRTNTASSEPVSGVDDDEESTSLDSMSKFGVSFEGVISFNSSDSTCTLSVRVDSEGIFKVVTANIYTFQDLQGFEEVDFLTKKDLKTELLKLKTEENSANRASILSFMLCFTCNTSYSSVVGLSEHGMLCHDNHMSDDEKLFFTESAVSVVFQPLSPESSKIAVLVLDNIREVSLESLKLASRHLVQGNSSFEDEEPTTISSILNAEGSFGNYSPQSEFGLNSNSILSHMAMCHSRNSSKTLKCPKCNWHYKYQQTLDAHMKEKHSEDGNNCEFCTNNEPHPKLSRGETYSCGYKPFKCEVCNYSTTTKGNLSIHMQSDKHLNNIQELKRNNGSFEEPSTSTSSTIPSITQSSQSSSVPGIEAQTSQTPTSFFKCPVCDFQTSNACSFKMHVATEHALLSMSSPSTGATDLDLASALLNQQQTTSDILQSLLLQRQLEAVAAVTNSETAGTTSLFMSGLDGVPQQQSVLSSTSGANESGVFTCSLCNKFCSDDPHLIQNHALRDRTTLTSQDYSSVNNNTFKCLLCNYSTNLKANFTLHSQTEKHKQKVQVFNHLKEGNENLESILTIIHQISPIQISCNACDFQAKSIGQLNAHLTADSHILSFKLFEIFTSLSSKPGVKFNCKVCNSGFVTKPEIISHVQQPQHCTKLRAKKNQSSVNPSETSWHDYFEIMTESYLDKNSHKNQIEVYGEAFNCPLCAKPSRTRDLLREHIIQDHRVSNDCIESLLAAVKPTMSVKPVARTPKFLKNNSENCTSTASLVSTSEAVTEQVNEVETVAESQPLAEKYKCHRCRKEFIHTLELYDHLKTCLSYFCFATTDCKQHFPTHNLLSAHISFHPDYTSNVTCWDPNCGQLFQTEESLIQHFFDPVHLSPALTCSTCLATFLSETTFSAHILNSSCNDQNSRSSQLEYKDELLDSKPIVTQYSQSPIRSFRCNNCSVAFVSQSNLISHQNSEHPQPSFSQNSDNKSKSEAPRTLKPFRCNACDVAYSSESTLLIHMASLLHKDTVNRQSMSNPNSSFDTNSDNSEPAITTVQSNSDNSTYTVAEGTKLNEALKTQLKRETSVSNSATTTTTSTIPESYSDILQAQLQQHSLTSSIAAISLLSNLGLQNGTGNDSKMMQDASINQQFPQVAAAATGNPLFDVQTQMALLQQQQFLLQHQKLLSSLMPFCNLPQVQTTPQVFNCNKCRQSFTTQEALTNHQATLCSGSKMNELFKISIASNPNSLTAESATESKEDNAANGATVKSQPEMVPSSEKNLQVTTPENPSSAKVSVAKSELTSPKWNVNEFKEAKIETCKIKPTVLNSSVSTSIGTPSVSLNQNQNPTVTPIESKSSLGSSANDSINSLRYECSENFQDEDDDNMFYSDEFPQSESDGCNSDNDSQDRSSASSNDQFNTNALILQQAALYQQLLLQNPSGLSAMFPNANFSNSGIGSQLMANNPFLSLFASLANGNKSVESSAQKQPRTKISEPQLEILKQNFDISNLPSEEKYEAMSQQTDLPVKVIKHWFRNTLFKERQKDKDSPYNFNNPPSSSENSPTQTNAMTIQQAIFNNMQSMLPSGSTASTVFDPTKFSLNSFGATQNSSKAPSPMSMFLQQQSQQHISSKRATRTRFSDNQIKALQDFFDQNPYPRDDDLENLSKSLNLSPRVVVVWFQNQRQKARRSMEFSTTVENPTSSSQVTVNCNASTPVSTSHQTDVEKPVVISLKDSTCLDNDVSKLVQEVVNMVAVNHSSLQANEQTEQEPPNAHSNDSYTTVVEPQPAPNYDLTTSVNLGTNQNSRNGQVRGRNNDEHVQPNNNDNEELPKLVIKEEPETKNLSPVSSNVHEAEFFYNCSLCPVIVASEEELEQHQRGHMEQVSLFVNGNSEMSDGKLDLTKLNNDDLLAMQRIRQKYGMGDSANSVTNGVTFLDEDQQSNLDMNNTGSHEYFRRMRTTISPDQLEILYTKYGENSNPSRTEMEMLANSVGLSRRVVQVWYQNTRARQRRGQCRVIGNTVYHCKCPYCDTICKSKSHLSQHVQKEHSDRAKNAIQIAQTSFDSSGGIRVSVPPNVTVTSKPNDNGINILTSIAPAPSISTMTSNKPLENLVASVSTIVNAASSNFGASLSSLGLVDDMSSSENFNSSKNIDENDELKLGDTSFYSDGSNDESSYKVNFSPDLNGSSYDSSGSVVMSSNSPGADVMATSFNPNLSYGMFSNDDRKRHRTHLSNLQVRILKAMFVEFKTPSMGECESIGNEIGLSKRVVQVWFQNARSKEKKGKPVGGGFANDSNGIDGTTTCQYCGNLKFDNNSALRDHLFTAQHVQAVKKSVSAQVREENGYTYAMPVPTVTYEPCGISNNNTYHRLSPSMQTLSPLHETSNMSNCAMAAATLSTPMDLSTKTV